MEQIFLLTSTCSHHTICFYCRRTCSLPCWVNRRESQRVLSQHQTHTNGRRYRFNREKEGKFRLGSTQLDSTLAVGATFKLIQTCMRNNWKRDFCHNFSFAFNFAFVSSPSLPSFTFNHNLSSQIFFSFLHFSTIGFFMGLSSLMLSVVECGITRSIESFIQPKKTFSHEAFFARPRQWKMKIEKCHKPVAG